MNMDTLKGKWTEIKGKIKQEWSQLTHDDLSGVEGNLDEISGRLQKVYGYSKEKAGEEYSAFKKRHNL